MLGVSFLVDGMGAAGVLALGSGRVFSGAVLISIESTMGARLRSKASSPENERFDSAIAFAVSKD